MYKTMKVQSKYKRTLLVIAFLMLALTLVGISGIKFVKADVGGSRDAVLTGLSSFLANNPNSPLASDIAKKLLLEIGGEDALGAAVTLSMSKDNKANLKVLGLESITTRNETIDRYCDTTRFPNSSSTFYSTPNLTREVWQVDYVSLRTHGPASAAIVISVGTSTVDGVVFNAGRVATETLPWGFLDRFYIGSGTGKNPRGVFVTSNKVGTSTDVGAIDAGS